MNIQILKDNILNGYKITKKEASGLVEADFYDLCKAAEEIRNKFCGNSFDLCSIINGKSGRCSENCRFCAQSAYYQTNILEYPLVSSDKIIEDASRNRDGGILRFSVVTSGRSMPDKEMAELCSVYKKLSKICDVSLCASHGFLSEKQFLNLKEAGVSRYHCNIETSRNYFPKICTTHNYDDKIKTIENAKKAGLEVCSGIIMGMGETFKDRIDAFFDLKQMNIKSIPLNILNPVKGTPFEKNEILGEDEVCRTIAIARFIVPDAALRLAGGRGLFKDKGKSMIMSGANAAISGDMLTTSGISFDKDKKLIKMLGFEIKPL